MSSSQYLSRKSFLRWFFEHLFTNPLIILIVCFGTCVTIFTRALIPIILGLTIDVAIIDASDNLLETEQLKILINFIGLIILFAIIQFTVSLATSFSSEWLSWSTQRRMREEFFSSMQNKPLKFHDSIRTGELMALATNDLGQVGGLISPGFSMMADVFISIVFSAFLVFNLLEVHQLIITSIPFFIAYVWAVFSYNKKMAPISATFMRKWGAIATAVQDNIIGAEVVRAFAEESNEREKFMKYVLDFRNTWEKQQILQARYFPTLILFSCVGFSVFIGLFLIIDEQLTIGGLIAFNGLLFTLLGPTYVISFAVSIFNSGLAGARRIHAMETREVGEDTQILSKRELKKVRGKVAFEGVSFKYPSSMGWILEDISFCIAPGQTIAIVGPTGSGKSSLTKLLLRLYDYEGVIKIDDIDIKEYTLESLRKNIGRIEQDIYLFPRTVRENIAFGARNAGQENVEKAAKLAQAHEFILKDLSEGYETNVGEGGSQLSGGQRQRIAIARTFLTDPRILILDDSTSSVDSKTEEDIVKAINAVSEGRTTFIITHRLSTIRSADCVIVIKGKKIVAKGHHSNLIYTSPDYRRIFGKYTDLPPLASTEDYSPVIGGT